MSELFAAIEKGDEKKAEKLLRNGSTGVAFIDEAYGFTPLMGACANKMKTLALKLVATGQSIPEHVSNKGFTALILACKNKLSDVAIAIINTGQSNPGHVHPQGYTALMVACRNAMPQVALALIATGQSFPEYVDDKGFTALSWACQKGLADVALNLIFFNTGQVDNNNNTPLMWACHTNMENVALALIATGQSNPDQVNNLGQTALMIAKQRNMKHVLAKINGSNGHVIPFPINPDTVVPHTAVVSTPLPMNPVVEEPVPIVKEYVVEQTPIVPGKPYYLGELLGSGATGTVHVANNQSLTKFAIKTIPLKSNSLNKLVKREVAILRHLQNHCDQYIICFVEHFTTNNIAYIVFEFLQDFMPLDECIRNETTMFLPAKTEGVDISTRGIRNETSKGVKNKTPLINNELLIVNLCQGIKQLHSLGVVHRDIKPGNIMVNLLTSAIKYIDFGLAATADTLSTFSSNQVGTQNYLDPFLKLESATVQDIRRLEQSDLWSLGITIYIVLSRGKVPWSVKNSISGLAKEQTSAYNKIKNAGKKISLIDLPEYRDKIELSLENANMLRGLLKLNGYRRV